MLYRDRFRVEPTRLAGWDYDWPGCYFVTICTRERACTLGQLVGGEMRYSPAGDIAMRHWLSIPQHVPHVSLGASVVMPNHLHGIIFLDEHGSPPWQGRETTARLQAGSLPVVLRSFKAATTRECRHLGYPFAWQSRYYDHVIRDEADLQRISEYILNNPAQWEADSINPAQQ